MRKRIREYFGSYFKWYKTIPGRTYKGKRYIENILTGQKFWTDYPYVVDWMGWFVISFNKGTGLSIQSMRLYPIYELVSNDFIKWDIKKIFYKESQVINTIEEFKEIDKEMVLNTIGIDFNGYIYINRELDTEKEWLNYFRSEFDPEFDLNIAKMVKDPYLYREYKQCPI